MNPDWTEVSTEIVRLLNRYRGHLPKDAIEEVERYRNHDEYEMAFEGLCIELMKLSDFSPADRDRCRSIAKQLGLDRESVFDPEFWQKLTKELA